MKTLNDLVRDVAIRLAIEKSIGVVLSISSNETPIGIRVTRKYAFGGAVYTDKGVYDLDEDVSPEALLGDARNNLRECLGPSHYGIDFEDDKAVIYPLEGVSLSERLVLT